MRRTPPLRPRPNPLPRQAFDRHHTYDWMTQPQRGELEYLEGSPPPRPMGFNPILTADYAALETRVAGYSGIYAQMADRMVRTTFDSNRYSKEITHALLYGTSHPEHYMGPGDIKQWGGHPSRELYEDAT